MDALEIEEKTGVPYRSRKSDAMHACGHDLHTAMLVGAAHVLASARDELAGSVVFMFQPGEEAWDGAGHMIREGVLDAAGARPVAAYALHVMSRGWPHGTFTTRPGPMLAASDALTVTVRGTGGHGSAPYLARDPVLAACEMALALQTFLSRSVDPLEPVVLTVGSFHAGVRNNVIPDTARFDATIRTFSEEVRDLVARGTVRVCEGIAAAHGLEVDAVYTPQYPVTVNDGPEAAFAGETVTEMFGGDAFVPMANPVTGAEDFSRVIAEVPGAMLFLSAVPPGARLRVAAQQPLAVRRVRRRRARRGRRALRRARPAPARRRGPDPGQRVKELDEPGHGAVGAHAPGRHRRTAPAGRCPDIAGRDHGRLHGDRPRPGEEPVRPPDLADGGGRAQVPARARSPAPGWRPCRGGRPTAPGWPSPRPAKTAGRRSPSCP